MLDANAIARQKLIHDWLEIKNGASPEQYDSFIRSMLRNAAEASNEEEPA